jgi:enoyl-[acyl-carrier-protein] reductase (NADH)
VKGFQRLLQPFRDCVAMQKLPRPRDYGQAAVFLASDNAAMITGTDLRVDAGAIAQYWAWDPSSKRS